jgi:hypothetical protein
VGEESRGEEDVARWAAEIDELLCRKNPDQLQTSRDASQDAARSYGLSGLQHTGKKSVTSSEEHRDPQGLSRCMGDS